MMTIGYTSNIKDTILDLWNTQASIAMIIDDTSNIKDVILSLEDINISTVFINETSNNKDTLLKSRRHRHKKGRS